MNNASLAVDFFLEYHVGHRTYATNLQEGIGRQPQIKATWHKITYLEPHPIVDRLPFLSDNVRGTLRSVRQIRTALTQSSSPLLFFNTQVPAALAGSLLRGRKVVIATDITPRQYDRMAESYNHQRDRIPLVAALKDWRNRQIFQRAELLLPWSDWVRQSLMSEYGISPERIEVIPPGIDLDRWRPPVKPRDGVCKILFVGGDFVRKGGPLLLEAFHSLPPGSAELHLVTKTAITPEQHVFVYNDLSANSEELIRLYQQSHIFALPSYGEAFGLAALEAAASGLPAIVSRVGGLPETVIDGESGVVLPMLDSAHIAHALHALVSDAPRRQQMGRAARRYAEATFDLQRISTRILRLLQQLHPPRSAGSVA